MENTKEKVLRHLYLSQDGYISGEEIASALGITRNSVWKAINSLKNDGYVILSQKNSGYRLDFTQGYFDRFSIESLLQRKRKIYFYDVADSSNTIAKELCKQGEKEGSIIIVNSQTSGRGRMGRSFLSQSKNGLYMSIVLRPSLPASKAVNITVMGASAVTEAIEELTQKECSIKWVNDIYIEEKKVCGILTEASIDFECGLVQYAVIGIGVNVLEPEGGFDMSIKDIAGSIYGNSCPKDFKARLCAKIVDNFFKYYDSLENNSYIKIYKEKSNIIGKMVDVYIGNKIISGCAVDIDDNANLIVIDEKGTLHTFNSGEARVRKNNG